MPCCFGSIQNHLVIQAEGPQVAAQHLYVNESETDEDPEFCLGLRRHNKIEQKKVDSERQSADQSLRALSLMRFMILIACSQEAS